MRYPSAIFNMETTERETALEGRREIVMSLFAATEREREREREEREGRERGERGERGERERGEGERRGREHNRVFDDTVERKTEKEIQAESTIE